MGLKHSPGNPGARMIPLMFDPVQMMRMTPAVTQATWPITIKTRRRRILGRRVRKRTRSPQKDAVPRKGSIK
jgi:hypothetical protein